MDKDNKSFSDAKIALEGTTVETRKNKNGEIPTKYIIAKRGNNIKQSWDSLFHRTITQLGAYEGRIFMRVVEAAQSEVKEILNGDVSIAHGQYDLRRLTFPLNNFLADEDDKNYAQAKKSLMTMASTLLTQEKDKGWQALNLIQNPKIDTYGRQVTFEVSGEIWKSLLNLSSGYVEYNLDVAISFRSKYTRFFYQILSKTDEITYSQERLREILGLREGQYERPAAFQSRVLAPSIKEMQERAEYYFSFERQKTKGSAIYSFKKIYNTGYEPEVKSQYSLIDKEVIAYLRSLGFSEDERENNKMLLAKAQAKMGVADLLSFIGEKKTVAHKNGMESYKGFIIYELKRELGLNEDRKGKKDKNIKSSIKESAVTVEEVQDLVSSFASKMHKVN